jgi:hypothetical protein
LFAVTTIVSTVGCVAEGGGGGCCAATGKELTIPAASKARTIMFMAVGLTALVDEIVLVLMMSLLF